MYENVNVLVWCICGWYVVCMSEFAFYFRGKEGTYMYMNAGSMSYKYVLIYVCMKGTRVGANHIICVHECCECVCVQCRRREVSVGVR